MCRPLLNYFKLVDFKSFEAEVMQKLQISLYIFRMIHYVPVLQYVCRAGLVFHVRDSWGNEGNLDQSFITAMRREIPGVCFI